LLWAARHRHIVGEFADSDSALHAIRSKPPDMVLLCKLDQPSHEGAEVTIEVVRLTQWPKLVKECPKGAVAMRRRRPTDSMGYF
jgi:hypothetical protein